MNSTAIGTLHDSAGATEAVDAELETVLSVSQHLATSAFAITVSLESALC